MSHKLKAIIIDDEKPARELIKAYLKVFTEVEVLAEGANGFEGVKLIQQFKPDLIFLDIQMPKVSGLEMLEVIENPPKVIFTTAYDQFAIKAFELNAIDYLLKPFSKDRFEQAVKKVLNSQNTTHKESLNNLIDKSLDNENSKLTRIVVKKNSNLEMIPVDEVIYIEASDDFVFIHTADNRYIKSRTMKYFQSHLNEHQFVRIHRSYIVNILSIHKIEQYEKDSHVVVLKNSDKINASKNGYKLLKDVLGM
ncbi:LytR/AlgR family response regulator transcription factor [Plebeiibacterium sediminum]|uniref:LytTR family transcriptional regulator DNA-binding domain-containing protein n=1 Tax=Plebeiibacterium sediminum TaxID=2992112 RepID=A0AAE3M0S2_9BACT|nr:LytTR family transcriptional regulator DNA-binding domain-containing protein [Plebeiobacterium sediminum]MCW3785002.1 LytTR family transcriptional regulator DNA-binding domain-containing protein [Plebeiobacterium sediminum]